MTEMRLHVHYAPDQPREYSPTTPDQRASDRHELEQLITRLSEFADRATLTNTGALAVEFTAEQQRAGNVADTTRALTDHGYSPSGLPRLSCATCGYMYPPGTSVGPLDGTVLDPIVESGGRSGHPDHCARSEAPPRAPACGIAQFMPASWAEPPKRGRRRK